jgi:hypothetical protein
MVVDPRGVKAGDADIREEMAEEAGARLGEFVQDERGMAPPNLRRNSTAAASQAS